MAAAVAGAKRGVSNGANPSSVVPESEAKELESGPGPDPRGRSVHGQPNHSIMDTFVVEIARYFGAWGVWGGLVSQ